MGTREVTQQSRSSGPQEGIHVSMKEGLKEFIVWLSTANMWHWTFLRKVWGVQPRG